MFRLSTFPYMDPLQIYSFLIKQEDIGDLGDLVWGADNVSEWVAGFSPDVHFLLWDYIGHSLSGGGIIQNWIPPDPERSKSCNQVERIPQRFN